MVYWPRRGTPQSGAKAMAKTILVVDDERKIVTVLKGYLEQAGLPVVTAGDGQMALTTFRHAKPDLVARPEACRALTGWTSVAPSAAKSSAPIIMPLPAPRKPTD